MPGYNAHQIANNVLNGNNVAVMIGDVIVAFAQTAGYQLAMGTEQLYGIGTAKPQEVQQLRMSPAFSLDSFALTAQGVTLLGTGARIEYQLAGKSYDVHLLDRNDNAVLISYIGAKCQNFGMNVPANAPIRHTLSFLALDVLDAEGNSIMDSGDNALAVASTAGTAILSANNTGISA